MYVTTYQKNWFTPKKDTLPNLCHHPQPTRVPVPYLELTVKNKEGIVTDISCTFVPRQNESKIRHMTFQDHVNTVRDKFFEIYNHRWLTVRFTRKIHNNNNTIHIPVIMREEIRMFWFRYRFFTLEKTRVNCDINIGQTSLGLDLTLVNL